MAKDKKKKSVKPSVVKESRGKVNPETELSDQQEKFCREYLKDFNATQAAIRAGYSPKTARNQASRLLASVNTRNYLEKLQKPELDKFEITRERTLGELARLAYTRQFDFMSIGEDGLPFHDFRKATPDQLAGIAGIEVTSLPPMEFMGTGENGEPVMLQREVIKVKTKLDKTKALELLMKHQNLLQPDTVVNNTTNISAKIDESETREIARRVAFMLRKAAQSNAGEKK